MTPKRGDIVCLAQDRNADHPHRILYVEQAYDPADRPLLNTLILVLQSVTEVRLPVSGVSVDWVVTKSYEEQTAERLMA